VKLRALALAVLCFGSAGCFRTLYVNLRPPNTPTPVENDDTRSHYQHGGGWQSFFVWGWFPSVKKIDASAICGGDDHVSAVETQQTFTEGLVASAAGYYVNVYSPWGAVVHCDHVPIRR